jgi:hypothetical protein
MSAVDTSRFYYFLLSRGVNRYFKVALPALKKHLIRRCIEASYLISNEVSEDRE